MLCHPASDENVASEDSELNPGEVNRNMRYLSCGIRSRYQRRGHRRSGQALVEFSAAAVVLILLLFGLIDFALPMYYRMVMIDISREGSNIAARGPGSTQGQAVENALNAMMAASNPLQIMGTSTNIGQGRIYVSAVAMNNLGTYTVTSQATTGGLDAAYARSKVGRNGPGTAATLPVTTPQIPYGNRTLYVTEVYYQFRPAAPLGGLVGFLINTQLYDVAYF